MGRDIMIRALHIKLCQKCSSSKGHDPIDNIVYLYVLHRKGCLWNSIIDTMAYWAT